MPNAMTSPMPTHRSPARGETKMKVRRPGRALQPRARASVIRIEGHRSGGAMKAALVIAGAAGAIAGLLLSRSK